MPDVTTDEDAYQSLADIRQRVTWDGREFYDDNEQLRFDELLVRLERESRGIFETLWGDVPPTEDEPRTDTLVAHDDAAILLAYPVQSVESVEIRRSERGEWREYDADRYYSTKHRLVLDAGRRQGGRGRNTVADAARRATWGDIATRLRVTYDRGFDEVPDDIKSVQIALINRLLRQRRADQTVAAGDPEQIAASSAELDNVVTDEIRQRIADVTSPGGATLSV